MVATPQPRTLTLSRFVDNVAASAPTPSDWHSGPPTVVGHLLSDDPFVRLFQSNLGVRAHGLIGNEQKSLRAVSEFAANALATLLQQDMKFAKALIGQDLRPDMRLLIVHQESPRSSILILDPRQKEDTAPSLAPAQWTDQLVAHARRLLDKSAVWTTLPAQGSGDAIEALWVARPDVVISPQPQMISTTVRRPAGTVTCNGKPSAVGAYARDSAGHPGVTVCYHGTGDVGTGLSIDGVPRKVSIASEALDTCFVPIGESELPQPPPPLLASKGLLTKRAPGAQEHHTFWSGAENQIMEARIMANDFGLPQPTRQRQLCIYTDAVTNYGDSGGALLNDDDQLVGFAFQRTPFNRQLQFSTWIWAYSAFDELHLRPL